MTFKIILLITEKFIKKAIKQKANFILTPEVSFLFTLDKKELEKKTSSMKKDIYLMRN